MTVRLSDAQASELDAVAEVDGMATAEAIRRAVTDYIEQRRGDEDFRRRSREALERQRAILEKLAG